MQSNLINTNQVEAVAHCSSTPAHWYFSPFRENPQPQVYQPVAFLFLRLRLSSLRQATGSISACGFFVPLSYPEKDYQNEYDSRR
jgi:hypothetical protein